MIIVGTNLTRIMLMTMKAYQLICVVTGLSTCVRHSDIGRHLPVSSQNSSRISSMGTVGAGSRVQVGGKVLDLGVERTIRLEGCQEDFRKVRIIMITDLIT